MAKFSVKIYKKDTEKTCDIQTPNSIVLYYMQFNTKFVHRQICIYIQF